MATLDLLVQKNVLTVDDAQAVLKTAQSSLVNSPRVYGSLDGAENFSRGDQRHLRATRARPLERAPRMSGH